MDIKISSLKDDNLREDEIEILIKSPDSNENINKLIEYINLFGKQQNQKVLINNDNMLIKINYEDVICFYSDKKYNYCKTKDKTYKIKSKLYEIEKMDPNFIRISKSCIANSKHIKCFDLSETGRIVVIFDDESKEFVSRRKLRSIMEFLEERSIWYEKFS